MRRNPILAVLTIDTIVNSLLPRIKHHLMVSSVRPCRSNVLQDSLVKLVEACNDQSHSMDRWLSKLEASNWQTHVKEILTTACLAAQCIDRSVLRPGGSAG